MYIRTGRLQPRDVASEDLRFDPVEEHEHAVAERDVRRDRAHEERPEHAAQRAEHEHEDEGAAQKDASGDQASKNGGGSKNSGKSTSATSTSNTRMAPARVAPHARINELTSCRRGGWHVYSGGPSGPKSGPKAPAHSGAVHLLTGGAGKPRQHVCAKAAQTGARPRRNESVL